MKRSSSITIDRNRKAIAGVEQHYAHAKAIVLDGVSYAPSEIVKILQGQNDALDAADAAKVAFHQAVARHKATSTTADAVFLALKTRVLSDFKTSAETVGDFGVALPQRRKRKVKSLAEAAAKGEATRKARRATSAEPAAPPPANAQS